MENWEINLKQAPEGRRRVQPLVRPVTYDPTVTSYDQPKVKPVSYEDEEKNKNHFLLLGFMVVGIVVGLLSGIVVRMIPNAVNGMQYELYYGDGALTAHCLIYGAVLGALLSLILYPIYSKMKHVLPVYACLLFIPVLLFILTPVLGWLTEMVFAIIKVILGLLAAGVVLFIAYSWFCG
ncbi:MAG: hypothetical protein IKK75_13220 [Clostridia bacterium]|nr:hypothetical protein [Clostridia bacterium]